MRTMLAASMKELQAFALAFVIVSGLVLGITEPWDNATPQGSTSADEDGTSGETSAPDDGMNESADAAAQPSEPAAAPRSEQCLDSHNSLAMHIHPRVELVIDGQNIDVPDDLGIDTSACVQAMHLLHTHDATGKLHIEGYETFSPTAQLIFEVWNISFPEDDTLQPLFDEPARVSITVNGVATEAAWHDIELKDGETLRIEHTA